MRSQNGSISNGVKSRSTFKQIPKFTHQSILGNKSELADNGPISQLSDEGNPKVVRVWPPTDDNLRIFDVVVLADVHHRRRKRVARMIGGITVFGEENGSKKKRLALTFTTSDRICWTSSRVGATIRLDGNWQSDLSWGSTKKHYLSEWIMNFVVGRVSCQCKLIGVVKIVYQMEKAPGARHNPYEITRNRMKTNNCS